MPFRRSNVVLHSTSRARLCSVGLSQTYKNTDIIVTDDASTLDRKEQASYMAEVMAQNNNIKYIQNRRNQGFVGNLNTGLSNATGTYLSILFDDDFLDPLYIQSAVDVFKRHDDVAFVSMGVYNELEDGNKTCYVPNVCGKMSKYTYMYHVDYRRHDGVIRWSVSPGNHVFRRHPEHLFRTEFYDGWQDRQLKRGVIVLEHLLPLVRLGSVCIGTSGGRRLRRASRGLWRS